jgi:hypothetical protein
LISLESLELNLPKLQERHKGRREYLRYELQQMIHLSNTTLIETKFEIVRTALELSHDELFWYFLHLGQDLDDAKKGKPRVSPFDVSMTELLWLHKTLCNIVHMKKDGIFFPFSFRNQKTNKLYKKYARKLYTKSHKTKFQKS